MFRTAQSFGELAAVWVFVALAPWAVAHAQSGGREVRANPPTGAPIERTFRGTPLACGPLAIEVRDGEVAPPRPRVLGWAAACEAERGSVPRARVARLAEVEGRLREARAALARLDEAAALRTLAEGIRLAEELADVPGTAGWLAELELQLGLAAAQSGLDAVARDAFRRAVGFDPERRVEAAEAPPSVLEMAEAISRARRTTPYGSFDVTSSAPGARVFVDDVDAGLLPARVRVPVGRHLLRVEAPLHVTFGTVIDVFEGDRAPIAVPLAESLDVGAVDALLEAAANARFGGMVEASMDLGRSAGLDVAVRTIETHGSRA
ncbi:MAG: PEGA domain-containing protein, partial [Myxococcales bacterium]|nr:PEGA domain-containing protein [Myxococcales bacterium]